MTDEEQRMLAVGRDVVDQMRANGAELDGTDESVWFVHGAIASIADADNAQEAEVKQFAYSVYLADLLAATCAGVATSVAVDDGAITEVVATGAADREEHTLSWVRGAVHAPEADNIVFKYASALLAQGESARGEALLQLLRA